MEIVGLAGFAGVVVFGLLYVVFYFKDISLKLPAIGMAVFALVIAAAAVIPVLEFSLPAFPALPDLPFIGAAPSQTAQTEAPDEGQSEAPGAGGFPQLLLNKRGITITATGLVDNGAEGAALNVYIENRSETNVTVQIRDACVNGWMADALFSADVNSWMGIQSSILFPASRLERSGIEAIAVLDFSFHILNQDRVTFLDSDTVTVRTPAAGAYRDRFDSLGEELFNENGVRIVSGGFDRDASVFGPGLVLFMENATGRAVTVQAKDVLIDLSAADVIFSEDISAGRRSAAVMVFAGASLEEMQEVSFCLRVLDRDQRTVLFDTDPLTIVV